jgi:hypothetical protein
MTIREPSRAEISMVVGGGAAGAKVAGNSTKVGFTRPVSGTIVSFRLACA